MYVCYFLLVVIILYFIFVVSFSFFFADFYTNIVLFLFNCFMRYCKILLD